MQKEAPQAVVRSLTDSAFEEGHLSRNRAFLHAWPWLQAWAGFVAQSITLQHTYKTCQTRKAKIDTAVGHP